MNSLTIEAGKTERQYWKDIWKYRELFYFLAWRDLLVRYKQTVVGVAWAVVRPFLTMLILTLVFKYFGRFPANDVPYPLLVFSGMLPWQFFSAAVAESGSSLVSNSHLVSKVYFPRLVVPASSIITGLVDLAIATAFLGVLMAWYHFVPPWTVVLLPVFALMAFAAALGIGLWVSALTVWYRDLKFIIQFITQFGLYLAPVAYSSALVGERCESILPHARLIYSLNPMVGIIDGFRWCVLGDAYPLYWPAQIISLVWVVVLIATGIWYFRRTERTFADVI